MNAIEPLAVEVWLCAAGGDRLRMIPPVDGVRFAVAPDEMHVVCASAVAESVRSVLESTVCHEGGGQIFRVTASWHARLITGDTALQTFSSLVSHEIPGHRPCVVQGQSSGVATRAVVTRDQILVLVNSVASHVFDARLPGGIRGEGDPQQAFQRLVQQCAQEVVR